MKHSLIALLVLCFTYIANAGYVMASDSFDTYDLGEWQGRKQLVATAYSEAKPQQGQNHRSGENFRFYLPNNVAGLEWIIYSNYDPVTNIRFDVKYDRTLAIDPTVYSYIGHQSFTRTPSIGTTTSIRYYIANPVGATGDFRVEVWAYLYD